MAWLVDPEKEISLDQFSWIQYSNLDLILVGGSGGSTSKLEETITCLRKFSGSIPICIFPGSNLQISVLADGLLFLTLISGTNPDFLISQQAKASIALSEMDLEVLPTGYLLVNDGEILSVHKASNTLPIHNTQLDRLKAIALAGKFLGLNYFYLEAGSGAKVPVAPTAIRLVKKSVGKPIIVGGGLDSAEKVKAAFDAGADMVVLGNSIEKDPEFLSEVLTIKSFYNQLLNIN